jgi:hypothetical protein
LFRPKLQPTILRAALVHHHGEVAPERAHLQVRDIAHPDLVRVGDRHLQLPIGNAGKETLQVWTGVADRGYPSLDPLRTHDSRHPILPHALTVRAQHPMYTRATVGASAVAMHPRNVPLQINIGLYTRTGHTLLPRVVASTGHTVNAAHQRDLVFGPVGFDKLEDLRFRAEANRMAFFNSSCSSRSTL